MHHRKKRAVFAAVIAAVAVGATPALASAASSSCLYNPTTKQVSVTQTGHAQLEVLESDGYIAIRASNEPVKACTNMVDFFTVSATVTNTDGIVVSSWGTANPLRLTLHQLGPGATTESDGVSEIETTVTTSRTTVDFRGSSGRDQIKVGQDGINFGFDEYATDNDVDVLLAVRPDAITVRGLEGDDGLSGRGNYANPRPTTVPLTLNGDQGSDFVEGGLGRDILFGGGADDLAGNDRLYSDDGARDQLLGGPGWDTAYTDPVETTLSSIEVHSVDW